MTNFSVNFTNAWWLLLLIPAFALTLISYFKLNKRYRFTRNRIVSIVMHLVIMVLSIALLAGITIEYYKPNTETEVILLVDHSYTLDDSEDEIDNFIKAVVDNCDSMYKLGVVKFGYDQVYAVELTNNMSKVYSGYLSSPNPDTTATDISSALSYAASLFKRPETARIVLLSDALETDSSAKDVIKSLAAKGISVDTVYYEGEALGHEVQIIGATQSVPKVEINSTFNMDVTVQSSYTGPATITPYDNNVAGSPVAIELVEGVQTVSIPYSFAWGGMHVMSFEIACDADTLAQNNTYVNYIYIETFTEVLVIESIQTESESLVATFGEELNVKVVNVNDSVNMPTTLNELREFDEIVLVNIANDDLPDGFDAMLYEYVYTIGGGLFTVCGNEADATEDDWTANAYTREDMYGTLYQEMLPVEIVEYTAPVGVIIVIDTSGSMTGGEYQKSKLYWAMQGAQACLDALTERDYVGIMTLSDSYTEELTLTPRTQRDKILAAIADLEESALDGSMVSGGTIFSAALERAGKALAARSDIEKKHIIIVTDGEPSSGDTEMYQYWAQENAKLDITMSIVGIDTSAEAQAKMKDLLLNHAGCDEDNFHNVAQGNYDRLPTMMREDLETPDIKSVNYEPFTPKINAFNAVTNGINQADIPMLEGYYGVKLKPDATAVLMGKYTPI
jgi:Mg-chelatase subunit ChlD